MAAEYGGSVEQVHRAFSDEQYWLARLTDSGADDYSLDSMVLDGGGIDVVTTQTLRADRLPAVVTQFHRGDLSFVREETWTPVRDGQATATIKGSITGAPATLSGSAVLAPANRRRRLATGVQGHRRGQHPPRRRQDRELHRQPAGRPADRGTTLHHGVDHGERLTCRLPLIP